MKGHRGIPRLYHVKYKDRTGAVKQTTTFYADVWRAGHRRRVSLGSPRTDATRRLLEILRNAPVHGGARTLKRLSDLFNLVTADYQRERYASAARLPVKIAHVHRLMGDPLIEDTDTAAIRDYQNRRLAEGAARGTVELETCAIGRGFSIARELGLIRYAPKIPHLHLDNARQGFYRREDFEAIAARLAPHWRILAWTAYFTGWRPHGELLTRQWRHVDLERGWIRLEPAEAKNGHGRECPLVPELLTLLKAHRDACTALEKGAGRVIPWIFYNPARPGHRLHEYKEAWKAARNAAGMPGRILYDCRRTRTRNLHRAGVAQRAGMEWVGHRDPKVHMRYGIVDEVMLNEARDKAAAFEDSLRGETSRIQPITAGEK